MYLLQQKMSSYFYTYEKPHLLKMNIFGVLNLMTQDCVAIKNIFYKI